VSGKWDSHFTLGHNCKLPEVSVPAWGSGTVHAPLPRLFPVANVKLDSYTRWCCSSAAIMLSALPSHFSKRPNHMTIDRGRRDDDERERMTGGTMKEEDDRMKTKRRREKKTNEKKRVKDDEEVGKLIR
jgi:hypothetical protein